jgi:hypothetical protein
VTWQDRTGHVAAPGRDTCHAFLAFSAYGLDQLECDTCHHWMGDTWHLLTSASAWTGDVAAELTARRGVL